jgi:uncharacterized SAM-binding protein YcdF (DUF218 family)
MDDRPEADASPPRRSPHRLATARRDCGTTRPTLVVLGNGLLGRDGSYRISRACRRLVAEAERVARRVDAGAVVFSGWSPEGGPSEAEQMRAAWRGPAVELLLEETASTTAENAARTLPLLIERGVTEAIVVCTPLHLPRARWIFRRVYGARGVAVRFRLAAVAPTPGAVAWELGALTVLARQVRAAQAELDRG